MPYLCTSKNGTNCSLQRTASKGIHIYLESGEIPPGISGRWRSSDWQQRIRTSHPRFLHWQKELADDWHHQWCPFIRNHLQHCGNSKGKQPKTVWLLRISLRRDTETYGRYQPVLSGWSVTVVTKSTGRDSKELITRAAVRRLLIFGGYSLLCVYHNLLIGLRTVQFH